MGPPEPPPPGARRSRCRQEGGPCASGCACEPRARIGPPSESAITEQRMLTPAPAAKPEDLIRTLRAAGIRDPRLLDACRRVRPGGGDG